MINQSEQSVYNTLGNLGIKYEKFTHKPALTMQDCQDIDGTLNIPMHCKNLFLTNRQKTQFYLLLLGANKRFKTAEVSKLLGVSRLSFADDQLLFLHLKLLPGAVNPLSLINDENNAVKLIVDSDLKAGPLCFHPGVNTASIVMKAEDFYQVFLPHVHHEPEFIDILVSKEA